MADNHRRRCCQTALLPNVQSNLHTSTPTTRTLQSCTCTDTFASTPRIPVNSATTTRGRNSDQQRHYDLVTHGLRPWRRVIGKPTSPHNYRTSQNHKTLREKMKTVVHNGTSNMCQRVSAIFCRACWHCLEQSTV